jgi:L-lactate dehydrogenase
MEHTIAAGPQAPHAACDRLHSGATRCRSSEHTAAAPSIGWQLENAMRVGIIGVGAVGSSVAMAVLQAGVAEELLLHDRAAARAEGEAMDMAHGSPFYPRAAVRSATLDQVLDCDALVFAAGRNSRPGETRLQLLADNARVARDVGQRLAGSRAVVVVVSNPVDVLTHVLLQASGLPPAQVVGTGTMLDTARLRQRLGRHLGINPHSVHAQVLGEHGDSEFVQWSAAQVGGRLLRDTAGWSAADEEPIATEVRTAGYQVIERKGVTNHAIGLVTANLLRAVQRDEQRVLTVSRQQPGGVALSMPTVVGRQGGHTLLPPVLDAAETAALARSSAVLQQAWDGLQASLPSHR